ncbi:MAG: SDR family oxidoreductase [Dehalococcoidia bacterium]|nr:SDR family oxidoreductase [Dehalococcoidia bacterium]
MVLERLRLDGPPRRVAIVTGGGRSLGREMALSLSDAGADVCIASRTLAQLEETADFIGSRTGRRPLPIAMNVQDPASCDQLVEQVVAHFGRLDIMLSNAGIGDSKGAGASVTDLTDADWRDAMGVNLDSAFYCARAAVRQFRAQGGGGVIVNVASGSAMRSFPQGLGYSTAKGGVLSFTKSLAGQVIGEGIRVNCIVPGYVQQSAASSPQEQAGWDQRGRFNPTRRVGEAWELGPLAVFLCSDASSYITAETFVIDGGGLAGGIAPIDWPAPEASYA